MLCLSLSIALHNFFACFSIASVCFIYINISVSLNGINLKNKLYSLFKHDQAFRSSTNTIFCIEFCLYILLSSAKMRSYTNQIPTFILQPFFLLAFCAKIPRPLYAARGFYAYRFPRRFWVLTRRLRVYIIVRGLQRAYSAWS